MPLLNRSKAFASTSVTGQRRRELLAFQKQVGIRFRNLDLLNLAFAHRSYANEAGASGGNNEKLEFLGDSVLGMVISEYLFSELPEKSEGDLAKIKSFVVSESILAEVAMKVGLDNYVLIGRGEECSGGRTKKAILADALEAIIGAYYVDSGLRQSSKFVLKLFVPSIDRVLENKHDKDYKTLLQEYVQKRFKTYPRYRVVHRHGPDHNRTFLTEVRIRNQSYGRGQGKNKKEAEQRAAAHAYQALQGR